VKNEANQNDLPDLLSPSLLEDASLELERILAAARERCFQGLSDGDYGRAIIKHLRRYLTILLRQIKGRLKSHSKYFLLYHSQRLRLVDQFIRSKAFRWDQEEYRIFSRELLAIKWHYHRLTLAMLKYGTTDARDMKKLPPRVKGATGYAVPSKLTREDVIDLHLAVGLMGEFEWARYCLKRAGKGGRFVWKDRQGLRFDVELTPNVQRLVDVFDDRATTVGNVLQYYGSWAPAEISHWFPLPEGGAYTLIHPWPRAHVVSGISLGHHVPMILTLVPNVARQGKELQWREPVSGRPIDSPSWLFEWGDARYILPRIELIRGVMKKHLELSHRPSYEPEDLVFTLSAITEYAMESGKKTPALWFQIFSFGYSLWTDADEIVIQEVLPRFSSLRRKCLGSSESNQDRDRLLSVVDDITWDGKKCKQIDILRAFPTCLILPIGTNYWLIDWSLMSHTLLDFLSPYGRMKGAVAMLRGRDFEKALGDYVTSSTDKLGGDVYVWRLGHEQGPLKFNTGRPRDADIAIVVKDYLILIEAKAHAGKKDLLLVGAPDRLQERWERVVQPSVRQADTLANRTAKEPKGKNFEIPHKVNRIVALVCGPLPEWIPSSDKEWWLYDDIPRVCTPQELLDIISRIQRGQSPNQNVISILRK